MDTNISFTCSICSTGIHEGTTLFRLSSCGHIFHRQCIAEYFKNPNGTEAGAPKCPDCKSNTPTTPIKSISTVQSRRTLAMMSPESPVNDRRSPFGALTNTPSPRRKQEAQNIHIRELDLIADANNGPLEAHTPDTADFDRNCQIPKTTPTLIPFVRNPQSTPRTLFRKRTFLIDPDVAHLPLEERLQKFRDRVKAEPVYNMKQ